MNELLQWEIDWINTHPEMYDGDWHRKAVIGNIIKMYHIKEAKKFMKTYYDTGDDMYLSFVDDVLALPK